MSKSSVVETIVRGVLLHNGKVLLCQNRKHGHVFLPGGHIDFGEPARIALEREMREELGADLLAGRFLGACESSFEQPSKSGGTQRHHEINLVFQLEPRPGAGALHIDKLVSQEEHIQFIWRTVRELVDSKALLPVGIAALLPGTDGGPNGEQWVSAFE